MDIVVIGSTTVRNEDREKRATRVPEKNGTQVDRRRNREDRRKSVRDGVSVSLSFRKERRRQPDRRRTPGG